MPEEDEVVPEAIEDEDEEDLVEVAVEEGSRPVGDRGEDLAVDAEVDEAVVEELLVSAEAEEEDSKVCTTSIAILFKFGILMLN